MNWWSRIFILSQSLWFWNIFDRMIWKVFHYRLTKIMHRRSWDYLLEKVSFSFGYFSQFRMSVWVLPIYQELNEANRTHWGWGMTHSLDKLDLFAWPEKFWTFYCPIFFLWQCKCFWPDSSQNKKLIRNISSSAVSHAIFGFNIICILYLLWCLLSYLTILT